MVGRLGLGAQDGKSLIFSRFHRANGGMDEAATLSTAGQPAYSSADLKDLAEKWLQRIKQSETRETNWREEARKAEKAYAGDASADAGEGQLYDFNILFSNVETIVPAVYNSTPVPDVRRRYTTAIGEPPQDPTQQILMQAAQQAGISPEQAQQLALTPQGQQMADQALKSPQAQAALAQYQQAAQAHQQRLQLDKDSKALGDMIERAITVQIDDNKLDVEVESVSQDSFLSGRGVLRLKFDAIFGPEGTPPTDEHFEFEAVSWRDFRMGPAKRWENVPWIAFKHAVARETLEEKYTDEALAELQVETGKVGDLAKADDDVEFWEIWCKVKRTVYFIRADGGKVHKIVEDPLRLRSFFPTPRIVQPITLTGSMKPVCQFSIYRKLADELDLCTKRINKIMKALKVRGMVAGAAKKLIELAEADDNEIIVLDDLEALEQTGGLEKQIMWWPLEQAVKALMQLYAQRDQIKESIYEITGISDIVRGASKASETLGAQQIKTQWGSLRIQKMQRLIERLVRDTFGLMAEIICSGKFSDATLQEMTGIEITEGMRAIMRRPVFASYRVNVESDSTVRADLSRVKGEMAEFMRGTGQYFQTMGPLVAQAPEMAEPASEIYGAFARIYKLGKSAEDAVESLVQRAREAQKSRGQSQTPDQVRAQAEQEAAARQAQHDAKIQAIELEQAEIERDRAKVERDIKVIDLQIAQQKLKQALLPAPTTMPSNGQSTALS
jgi:hypothetical protein